MSSRKPIQAKPVKELTWRLLGGESDWYTPEWGEYGKKLIRDDFSRLYLISHGFAVVRTQTEEHHLEAGRFYIIPSGTSAYYSCPEGMHLSWLHFNIYVLPGLDLLQAFDPPLQREAPHGSDIAFEYMLGNISAGTPAGLSRACSIAARLVTPFLTAEWEDIFNPDGTFSRVQPVIEYIHSNLSSELTLPKLAKVAGVHPVYLSRIFKRATGHPPAKYVAAARMSYASDQLRLTAKRISEIGAESGFEDPYHFSRAFKHFVGVAPREYRRARVAV